MWSLQSASWTDIVSVNDSSDTYSQPFAPYDLSILQLNSRIKLKTLMVWGMQVNHPNDSVIMVPKIFFIVVLQMQNSICLFITL